MIHLFTSRKDEYDEELLKENGIKFGKTKDFYSWLNTSKGKTQLDTETDVVRDLRGFKRNRKGRDNWSEPLLDDEGNKTVVERKCHVVQIGDDRSVNQYIFDIPGLKGKKLEALFYYLRSDKVKILHNALFDYVVIKYNFGIDIKKIECTYIKSRALFLGRDMGKGWHSLAGCCERYLGYRIKKDEQDTFDGSPMTLEQIQYAALDVVPLAKLNDRMDRDIEYWGLENSVRLDCAFTRPLGDGMVENFFLNKKKWKANMKEQEAEVENLRNDLFRLMNKHFPKECRELGFIQKEDEYNFRWGSPKLKHDLIKLVHTDLPDDCTTIAKYKKFLAHKKEEDVDTSALELLLAREYNELADYFVNNHKEELKELGVFIPADTYLINFNSPAQTTPLFQLIDPSIEDSTKDTLAKLSHPLVAIYQRFVKASKLATSYGANFLDFMDDKKMLRIPKANIMLETGRVSLGLYQLLPGMDSYRNCFYTWDDWSVIGIDYDGQEAVVAATVCQEPKLLNIFEKGGDFHSYCASLVFPDEWKALGGDPEPKSKPEDKQLLKFRQQSKVTSFGLFYGKSAVGLSNDLDIPVGVQQLIEDNFYEAEAYIRFVTDKQAKKLSKKEDLSEKDFKEVPFKNEYATFIKERYKDRHSKTSLKEYLKIEHKEGRWLPEIVTADDLIDRFFNVFPKVKEVLVEGAESASIKSHIKTDDIFGRIRFFDPPEDEKEKAAIIRKAMNFPIQGSSANMTKYAMVLCKKWIEDNDLSDKIKIFLPIHDEIISVAHDSVAEMWLEKKKELMEEAGEVTLNHKLQKCSGSISKVWQK